MNRPKGVFLGSFLGVLLVLSVATIMPILPKAEATTTTISSNTSSLSTTVNAGDTLIINPGVNVGISSLVNHGSVVNQGIIQFNSGGTIDNYGIFINAGGSFLLGGKIINRASGIFSNDNGVNIELSSSDSIDNYGTFSNYGRLSDTGAGSIDNFSTGQFNNYNSISFAATNILNQGHVLNAAGASFVYSNGRSFVNDGGVLDNSGSFTAFKSVRFYNINGAAINNKAGAGFQNGGYGTASGSDFYSNAGNAINNFGTFTNFDRLHNAGTFNNNNGATLTNTATGTLPSLLNNTGTLNNNAGATINNKHGSAQPFVSITIKNYGTVNNNAGATINNNETFTNECGGVVNNSGTFNGNPIVNNCSSYPITHMSDTTASAGYGVHAPKPARAEYVTSTSQLIGDKIDSITLKLKRVGTISGTAEIGMLDNNNAVTKSFGTLNVATLTTTYADYEFHLSNNELYTIQSGDRIGIKYTGGDANNWVSVMLDLDPADPFDGTHSYHQYFQLGVWLSNTDRDMYMVLKQTHA
jgi:hypothetical protein